MGEPAPWAGRRVLVTGASGFIGGHLVEQLVRAGASVRALVRYSSVSPRARLSFLPPGVLAEVEVVTGDVTDPETIQPAVRGAHTLFHLAALVAVPYSYAAPRSYLRTNVEGALNVFTAAGEAGVSRVIHVSTSEVYGTAQYAPMDEAHPLSPQSPYAASKVGADAVAASFRHSYGLPVATARPFNVYGPRQSARAVIPTIITQALARGVIDLGATSPTRDFSYVTDVVGGLLRLAEAAGVTDQVVNIGSGREMGVGEVVPLVGQILGQELTVRRNPERLRPPASEVERLWCDNSKARRLLGWQPLVSLEEGLGRTIDWYRENHPAGADHYEI